MTTRRPVCVDDFEVLARDKLSPDVWEYLSSGGADEITLRRNREAFDDLRLVPRVLRDTREVDTRCTLLGLELAQPVLLAPAALNRLVHADGELAVTRAAVAARSVHVLSTLSSTPIGACGELGRDRLWMQIYIQRDRERTVRIVRAAEDAGFSALCLTVDTPRSPARYREQRTPLQPGDIRPVNLIDPGTEWGKERARSVFEDLLDPSVTWDDVAWLRAQTKLPLVLKGILHAGDARLAADAGVDGIIVSNHGGRNVDTAPATIEVLPAIAHAVGDRLPILLDGGVRRGTDVIKALALGASAVLVGRPYLYALAVGGEDGVRAMLDLLRDELVTAMSLCGVRSVSELDGELLWRQPT